MPHIWVLSEEARKELWEGLVYARERSRNPTHELHSELNIYCLLAAAGIMPQRIRFISQHSPHELDRAIARAAYRMAAGGMPIYKE